jgi:hypothetical protein
MSLTKLGTTILKEAGMLGSAMGALSNFKSNIIPALKTVAQATPDTLRVFGRSLSGGAGKTNILNSFGNAARSMQASIRPSQLQALSTGAKGLATAGAIGYGLTSGNKDYKNTMQDITKWKQYKMVDDNNNPVNLANQV